MFSLDDGEDDDEDVEREPPQMPPWFGPPNDELGVVVPLGLVIARSENGVVALSHATVYSTGLVLGRHRRGAWAEQLTVEPALPRATPLRGGRRACVRIPAARPRATGRGACLEPRRKDGP